MRGLTGRTWGVISAVSVLASSFAFTPATLPCIDLCWFHRMTQLPCAGCGMTRSICCISHLEFARAWSFNPFGYFVYAAAIYLLFRPLTVAYIPGLERAFFHTKLRYALPICTVVCFLLFGFWRMIRIMTSS